MVALEERILQALSTVQDPDLKKDLVTLGMVSGLEINNNQVNITLTLTTPACPFQAMLKKACEEAIHQHLETKVVVNIDVIGQVTSSRQLDTLLPQVKNIIAIASGKGGVGKSAIASHLAVALAQQPNVRVGLLDADIFGPSIPTMFGCANEKPQVLHENGHKYIVPLERYGVKLLSIGFLALPDQAMIWRGPMASSALKQLLGDTVWGALDYLLIDLPPGTSDIHLTLVQAVSVTGAVIVTTPQKVALVDAIKGITMFKQKHIQVPILGLIENMAYFSPSLIHAQRYHIFGQGGGEQLSEVYQVPFIGQVPFIESICEGGDKGKPAILEYKQVAELFASLALKLAQQVSIRNAQLPPTQRVQRIN